MKKQKLNRIKTVLAEKERTGIWMADKLGKSKGTVSRWCRNEVQPSLGELNKIADLLEVSIFDLLVPNRKY